jgi:pyruvate/2-oxoglutarate dehydrogenase complex dihydrolipoamide dehydrogenase (E3) component
MKYDYDLVVIGGGAAGLTSAGLSASLGAKTALIENKKLGGDCTWYGCIPSKALLKAAKVANTFKTSDKYGIKNHSPEINFKNIISHVHNIQNEIYNEADKPEIYEAMGINVINAKAKFIDKHTVEITDSDTSTKKISAGYFIIAAGGSPVVPPIDGIDKINFHTNETIFLIDKLPEKLLILGAGPIGTEMAQAFNRLVSEVIVIDKSDVILQHDDKQLSGMLKNILEEEGIVYKLGYEVKKFEKSNSTGRIIANISSEYRDEKIECDSVLVSAGRKPNIDGLNLDSCGIKYNKRGIIIDKIAEQVSEIFLLSAIAPAHFNLRIMQSIWQKKP